MTDNLQDSQDNNDLQNTDEMTSITGTAGTGTTGDSDMYPISDNVTGNDVIGDGISSGDDIKITEGGITDVTGTVALGGSSDVGGTTDAAATADIGATTGAAGLDMTGTDTGTDAEATGGGIENGDGMDVGVTGIGNDVGRTDGGATDSGGADADGADTTNTSASADAVTSPTEIDAGTGLAADLAGGG